MICFFFVALLPDASAGREGSFEFLSANKKSFKEIFHGGDPDTLITIQGHLYMPKASNPMMPAAAKAISDAMTVCDAFGALKALSHSSRDRQCAHHSCRPFKRRFGRTSGGIREDSSILNGKRG